MKPLHQYLSDALQNLAEDAELTIADVTPGVMSLLLAAYFETDDKIP